MFTFKPLTTLVATMAVLTTAIPAAAPAAAPTDAPVVDLARAAPDAPSFVEAAFAPEIFAADITAAEIHTLAGLGTTVLACEHQKFEGRCWTPWVDSSACRNVPKDRDNTFTSIRNTIPWGYRCHWYEHFDCRGRIYDNQNDAKLQDGNGFFNDRISSIRCWLWAGGRGREF